MHQQKFLMVRVTWKKQTGSDGDQYKKDPRLDLGSGGQVLSGLRGALSKGGTRPDDKLKATGSSKLKAASWNIGTLTGKSAEVAEELWRRGVVVGCLQETRWKDTPTGYIGVGERRYKAFLVGNEKKVGGVGIVVDERWKDYVIEVVKVYDRLIMVVMRVGRTVCKFISAYAPQAGCDKEQKEEFYDKLSDIMLRVKEKEFVYVGGDFNGHVGKVGEEFKGTHGGFGIGSRNVGGISLLEFCDEHDLAVINTFFMKEVKHQYTYRSGQERAQVDYILVKKTDRKYVEDCKVIRSEYQHSLLVAVIQERRLINQIRRGCRPTRRIWVLNKPGKAESFEAKVKERWAGCAENAEDTWFQLKKCALEAADEVCGWTKGKARRKVTWWWIEGLRQVIDDKRKKFKIMIKEKTEQSKEAYKTAKREVKRAVAKAMEMETKKIVEDMEGNREEVGDGKRKLFKMAKQHAREKRDITGGQCIRDAHGTLCTDVESKKLVWKTYMEQLLNEENDWDGIVEENQVAGEVEDISLGEVKLALKGMKKGKACGISGVCSEFLACSGEVGIEAMASICNSILHGERVPQDWMDSLLVPVYKGKGDVRECGSYRGVKLLEHGMKVLERILDKRLRQRIKVDEMQFGFMPGRGTIDAIFIVRQMQEKYLSKKKCLYYCFVDLEKAFDRVPRKVIEFALRRKGVEEKLVQTVMRLYDGARTRVRVDSEVTEPFEVKVGVHQGSVLSPLLFVTVMDVLSEAVRGGLLLELLYADDLVIMAESLQELERKYTEWKKSLEGKGLRVNVGKTKVMIGDGSKPVLKSEIDPCSVCDTRVKRNSIRCNRCKLWVHAKCSGVKGSLGKVELTFICRTCVDGRKDLMSVNRVKAEKVVDGLEMVDNFCYLGDMMQKDGGCEKAVRERVRKGWSKYKELSGVLCNKRIPLKMRGVLYSVCVRTVITYGCENWPMKKENEDTLVRAERRMIRMMCGVTLANRERATDLQERIGLVDDIGIVVTKARLRWFGHVSRRDPEEGVKRAFLYKLDGKSGRGRPGKTWYEVVRKDMRDSGLCERDALDRNKWRNTVRNVSANTRLRGKRH